MLELDYPTSLTAILKIATFTHLADLVERLEKQLEYTVHSGPFTGLKLPVFEEKKKRVLDAKYGWNAPKLLGCYEQELHNSVERAIQRSPEVIVNIGCGEGYYAVGLAKRLPNAHIHAFDIDPEARKLCALTAEQNELSERVHIYGECTREMILEFAKSQKKTLFIIDCEGEELRLLNETVVPQLASCDLIIECHDFKDRNITPVLTQLFVKQHEVQLLKEEGRNPSDFPPLHFLTSWNRWLLMCEFRPEVMLWLTCWSRF